MDQIEVESGGWTRLGGDASRIRDAVFVREQRIPAELALDDDDLDAHHAVAYLVDDATHARRAIATGRLLSDGTIGRVAVLADARGRGAGSRVLDALLAAARTRGDARVRLYAQQGAVSFYRERGFSLIGVPFEAAGVAHVELARAL
jgi:predicted GNAT family N-acyltransferase